MKALIKMITTGMIINNKQNRKISMTVKLDLDSNSIKEAKVSNMPDITRSLPRYLFDLYQIFSVGMVLTYRNP